MRSGSEADGAQNTACKTAFLLRAAVNRSALVHRHTDTRSVLKGPFLGTLNFRAALMLDSL